MNKQVFILSTIMVLLCSMVSAATCSIDAKSEIKTGEEMYFAYTISSNVGSEIGYIPDVSCRANMPRGEIKEIWGKADAKGQIKGEYSLQIVNSDIEPQECTVKVTIISQDKTSCEKKIRISALPSLNFMLSSCTDSSCSKKQRTFVKGSTIYLKGNSAGTAQITAPDGTSQRVALPGNFAASQSGEYTIDVSATKSGYKPFASTASLFVIERAFTVPYADFSAKVGQAVIRPVFRAPSAQVASNTAATTAKKSSIRTFFSRVTGYFALIF